MRSLRARLGKLSREIVLGELWDGQLKEFYHLTALCGHDPDDPNPGMPLPTYGFHSNALHPFFTSDISGRYAVAGSLRRLFWIRMIDAGRNVAHGS